MKYDKFTTGPMQYARSVCIGKIMTTYYICVTTHFGLLTGNMPGAIIWYSRLALCGLIANPLFPRGRGAAMPS